MFLSMQTERGNFWVYNKYIYFNILSYFAKSNLCNRSILRVEIRIHHSTKIENSDLFVCLTSQSISMVMSRWSVNIITLFLGWLVTKRLTST